MFLSKREHIIMLSSIYQLLIRKGHKIYVFDILEESGWFEKGVQYVSLNYNKPEDVLDYGMGERESIDYLVNMFEKNKIDLVMFSGYSDFLMRVAIASKLMRIPALHIGSGHRTYNYSDEDEVLRQVTDHLIPFHATYTPQNSSNLLAEGVDPRYVKLIGCPVVDLVSQRLSEALDKSTILSEMGVDPGEYIAVVLNKRESIEHIDGFRSFSSSSGEYLILPLSKENKKALIDRDKYYETMSEYDILFMEIFDYLDHLSFIYNAKSVITDQEWVALESAVLRRPTTLLISPGSRPLYIRGNYVNIVHLDESLSKNIGSVYMKRKTGDVGRYYGGGGAAEALSEYLYEVPKLRLKYPQIDIYSAVDGDISRVSKDVIPEKYRRLLSLS